MRERKKVIWDEDNLENIEAHKPTRQKITEPKTPYHAAAASDGTVSPHDDDNETMEMAAQAEAIRSALTEVASTSGGGNHGGPRKSGGGWTSSEDEGASASEVEGMDEDEAAYAEANGLHPETSEDHEDFVRHRKAHYDEYRRLKALRAQGKKVVEDTDEEEDSANKGPPLENGTGPASHSSHLQS
ncbi:Putative protein phosphatase inhibitor 2 [Klebsormidium nitens]|uniref:Protein phosphatase inhibitor 2 n=1 Tax=Klebsormidium nitens TaxID=105231 RepID=A0A1Y1HZV3_KLENI|nr:Putative protein phosphatase inhibitor 2 [Klebsormidium nitens]|eukprot:GAQ81388.1 Putative protein phosphatase inhibitor 2 [Klebsormidium nitens]